MDGFLIFLQSIRWQDVVDITLNSYILFRCYVIFRITNAFRILIGLALLWIFQRLAVSIGLIVTSWVIQGITAVAALIIIVVFRNEIRSVFQVKNIKTLFWGLPQQSFHTPVQIIADSVMDLARKRIGALIVFPGKEDINEKIQNGILWDGAISKEMITSIFWEDNPVHDGAIIIEGDRIHEVGVILPLSHRQELPSYYGTRHRAAVGLAESTDSLVVVVSEERGTIQIVKGSVIMPVLKKDDLEKHLQQHLGLVVKDPSGQKKEKTELRIAAMVSVILITSVWLTITRGLDSLVTFEIPIEYMNRNPGMEILDASVNSIKIQLGGSGPLMRVLRPDHVRVKIDLGKSVVGQNIYTITNENISLPPGIILKSFDPAVVDVTLDVPDKKDLPVQVDWTGKLPENLRMEKITIEPIVVQIIGGRQLLKNITTVYTEKIPLESIQSSRTIIVNLALSPASLKVAPGFKDKITVECTVKNLTQNGQ
jgi:diadenylate cyclase